MTALKIEIDPADVGFAPDRLARIDRHFQGYIDQKKLAGWHVAVSRSGQLVHSSTAGHRDIASGAPFTDDTVVRMFSMTKPITSVAAMMLYEEGLLELKSPIAKWLPEFADTRVYRSGSFLAPVTEPQIEPIRVWHLLTHTSGLTYGFHNTHVTDAIYRRGGFEWGNPPGANAGRVLSRCGRRCRLRSSLGASGTTACRPTCWADSSRSCRAWRSTSSSGPGSSSHSA